MRFVARSANLSFRGAGNAREPGIHNHDSLLIAPLVVMDSGQPLRGFRNDKELTP
jgi:hypothetical protein